MQSRGPDGVVDSGTTNSEGLTDYCDPEGDDDYGDDYDRPEIRSKLVAYAPAGTDDTSPTAASTSYVLDGSSAELALAPDQNTATVYAIIKDQKAITTS